MSSIGSADKRASQDEALRRARETYQEKETDQAKNHSTEMKRMAEAHQAEVRKIQDAHDAQMEALKSKARDAISNRDMRYQKEIQDLRGLHQNQVRRQALEADGRIQEVQVGAKREVQKNSEIKDQQKQVMAQQYESELDRERKRVSDVSEKSRQVVQTSAIEQRQRLNATHQKEMKTVVEDRDRTRNSAQRNFDSLRKTKDGQIEDLDKAKRTEAQRLSENYTSNVKELSRDHDQNIANAREGFKEGIEKNRGRFEKALEERDMASKNTSEAFKSTVSDRLANRLSAGESKNAQLERDLVRQQSSLTRAKNREVQNTRDTMQANIENLESQRIESLAASNAKNKIEVDRIQKNSEELLGRTNRFFQEKMVADRGLASERHETTKMNLEKRLLVSEMTSDDRTNKLQAINGREEETLKSFYDKSSSAQRENYEQSLNELRETNKRDQDLIFKNFSKQSTEREMKFQAKLTEVNNKFESQIQILKEDGAKQLQNQIAASNKEKKVLVDQKNIELQRQAAQYENRIAKLEDTHKREVDGINKRHEESIVSMTRSKGRT